MKLWKIALFGGAALLIAPTTAEQRTAFYINARKTYADISDFCTRNPDVCDSVVAGFYGIGDKLGYTADTIEIMLYKAGIGVDRSQLRQPLADINATSTPQTTSSLITQDTLTSADRQPGWRGPR